MKVFFSLFLNVSLLVFFWNLSLDSQLSPFSLWAMSFFLVFVLFFLMYVLVNRITSMKAMWFVDLYGAPLYRKNI